jgi:hypothetical protein
MSLRTLTPTSYPVLSSTVGPKGIDQGRSHVNIRRPKHLFTGPNLFRPLETLWTQDDPVVSVVLGTGTTQIRKRWCLRGKQERQYWEILTAQSGSSNAQRGVLMYKYLDCLQH